MPTCNWKFIAKLNKFYFCLCVQQNIIDAYIFNVKMDCHSAANAAKELRAGPTKATNGVKFLLNKYKANAQGNKGKTSAYVFAKFVNECDEFAAEAIEKIRTTIGRNWAVYAIELQRIVNQFGDHAYCATTAALIDATDIIRVDANKRYIRCSSEMFPDSFKTFEGDENRTLGKPLATSAVGSDETSDCHEIANDIQYCQRKTEKDREIGLS